MDYSKLDEFYAVYAKKDCPLCGGAGYDVITDLEPCGDYWIDVPKGIEECPCTRLQGVTLRQWEPFTRFNYVDIDDEDAPF